jgi:F-type H+-transporting ATPase subunit b
MNLVLEQLGRLLRGSIPTIVFVVSLYWIYNFVLHKPLVRILAERRSRTEGAMEKARADIAAAEARTADYEQRLREARSGLFKAQEVRRHKMTQAREEAMAKARAQAQAQVQQARESLEQDKLAVQNGLQGESARLAAEIIRVVLRPGAGARS